MESPDSVRRLTLRAIALGVLISLLMAIGAPYSRYVLHTTPLVFTSFSWGVMVCWLGVLAVDLLCAHRLSLWKPLSTTELATAFIVGTVGSSMTTTEVAGLLVTNISGVRYYGSPENRWLETFGHLLPAWLIPTDANDAVDWLYDGAPQGAIIPWSDWYVPLFWNGSFAVAMYSVQFSLVGLLRKHWVEHERLTFPIMQVPLEMMRRPEPGQWLPPWMRQKLFWIGFLVPFSFLMLQAAHWFWPLVPQIPTNLGFISFGPEYPAMQMRIFWPVIGVSFFANSEIIFSLWFFNVLATLASGWVRRLGLVATAGNEPMQWLNIGALAVMVIWFMWQARWHLRAAGITALGRKGGDDDSRELLPYRTAYLMLMLGAIYMVVWMGHAGMGIGVALLLVLVSQVIYLGIARLAFEAGVLHVNSPLHTCNIIAQGLGSANLGHGSLAGLALVFWKFSNVKSLFLVSFGHAAALARSDEPTVSVRRRSMAGLLIVVVPLTTLVAIWYTMHLGFGMGGFNFGDFVFSSSAQTPYSSLMLWMTDPKPAETTHLSFMGVGAGLMAGFTALRYMLPWWPLHPIGLTICFSHHISTSFLSFLIAWIAKSLTIRLGGIRLYRQTIPLFIGVLIGSFAGGAICFVLDYVWFPLAGHAVFYY